MSHKKFGPDRFSRFDVYWIQTNKQTNKPNLYIDLIEKMYSSIVHHPPASPLFRFGLIEVKLKPFLNNIFKANQI